MWLSAARIIIAWDIHVLLLLSARVGCILHPSHPFLLLLGSLLLVGKLVSIGHLLVHVIHPGCCCAIPGVVRIRRLHLAIRTQPCLLLRHTSLLVHRLLADKSTLLWLELSLMATLLLWLTTLL
jgi:hypothetical protein